MVNLIHGRAVKAMNLDVEPLHCSRKQVFDADSRRESVHSFIRATKNDTTVRRSTVWRIPLSPIMFLRERVVAVFPRGRLRAPLRRSLG